MRVRTGHGPADWSPNIPANGHVVVTRYQSRPAATVGHMVPIVRLGHSEVRGSAASYSIHPENRVVRPTRAQAEGRG